MIKKLLIGISVAIALVFAMSKFLPGEGSVAPLSASARAVLTPTPTPISGKIILDFQAPKRVEIEASEMYATIPVTITATQDGKPANGVTGRLTVVGEPDVNARQLFFKTVRGRSGADLSLSEGAWSLVLYNERGVMVKNQGLLVLAKAKKEGRA